MYFNLILLQYNCKWHSVDRFSQSPSLLTSSSCSWPQREGLLSPEARQIYRRNFPSAIGFVQSGTVLLMRHQLNPITPQNVLIQIQLNCVFFLRAVFRFHFIACIQIQTFSARLIFLYWSTLPRPNFPCCHGARRH